MSYLGHRDRDLLIPPRPTQLSATEAWTLELRFRPAKPRLGPMQEASYVGIIALSLAWAAAEIAFLLWG